MSAQSMSPSELLDATVKWSGVASGPSASPDRAFLERSASSSMYLPAIDRCRALLSRMPADGSELARITDLLLTTDALHDDEGRFILGVFDAHLHHPDAEIATLAKNLADTFFPGGLGFIRASYADEGGMGVAREALMTSERRAQLARFPVASATGPQTLVDRMEALQGHSRSINELLSRRATLATDGSLPSAQEILDAKRELIRVVQQVLASWSTLDRAGLLDPTSKVYAKMFSDDWHQRVATATANAAARRAAAAAARAAGGGTGGGGGSPGTPTGSPTPVGGA